MQKYHFIVRHGVDGQQTTGERQDSPMTTTNEPLDALKEIDALLAPGESDPQRMADLLSQVAQIAAQAVADADD